MVSFRALRYRFDDWRDSDILRTESQGESDSPGHVSLHIEFDANKTVVRNQSHYGVRGAESDTPPSK